jgi:hypothetical protein
MKCNLGVLDRILRLILAAAVAILFFTKQLTGIAAVILGVLAVIFFLTSVIGFCPLYSIFDLSSAKKESRETPNPPEAP